MPYRSFDEMAGECRKSFHGVVVRVPPEIMAELDFRLTGRELNVRLVTKGELHADSSKMELLEAQRWYEKDLRRHGVGLMALLPTDLGGCLYFPPKGESPAHVLWYSRATSFPHPVRRETKGSREVVAGVIRL